MPGCLGLDAMWQLIGFYLGWLGGPGRGRALGSGEVKFSGQVTPETNWLLTESISSVSSSASCTWVLLTRSWKSTARKFITPKACGLACLPQLKSFRNITSMRRVVVTGLGITSSIGINQQQVLESLKQGKSGIVFAPRI